MTFPRHTTGEAICVARRGVCRLLRRDPYDRAAARGESFQAANSQVNQPPARYLLLATAIIVILLFAFCR